MEKGRAIGALEAAGESYGFRALDTSGVFVSWKKMKLAWPGGLGRPHNLQ